MGSVAVHVTVLSAIAGMMATAGAPDPKPRDLSEPMLAVQLVAVSEIPELEAGVTPPPRAKTETVPERRTPTAAPSSTASRPAGPSTGAPSPTPDAGKDDGNTFYVGPPATAQSNVPPGLASLMGEDPCTAKFGPKAKECAGRDLAKRTGKMDSLLPRPEEQLAQYYGDFMQKCPYWSGCDGSHLQNTNGTRSVAKPGPGSANDHGQSAPMAGGAASLGGINDLVGRLPQQPDFRDRGFGD